MPFCCGDVNKSEVPTNVERVLCEFRTIMKIMVTGEGGLSGILSFSPVNPSVHNS